LHQVMVATTQMSEGLRRRRHRAGVLTAVGLVVALTLVAAACGGGDSEETSPASETGAEAGDRTDASAAGADEFVGDEQWLQCDWPEGTDKTIDAEFAELNRVYLFERHYRVEVCIVGNTNPAGEPGSLVVELIGEEAFYEGEVPHPGGTLLSVDDVSDGEWTVYTHDVAPEAYQTFRAVVSAEPGAYWRLDLYELDEVRSEWVTDRRKRAAARMTREDLAVAMAVDATFAQDSESPVDTVCASEAIVSVVDDSRLPELALALDAYGLFDDEWLADVLTPHEQDVLVDRASECLNDDFEAFARERVEDMSAGVGQPDLLPSGCFASIWQEREQELGQIMVRAVLLDEEPEPQMVHLLFSAECFSRAFGDALSMSLLDAGLSDSSVDCIVESLIDSIRAEDLAELDSRITDFLEERFEASLGTCLTQEEKQTLGIPT